MEFVLADVTKPGRLPVAYPFSSAILHRAAPSLYNLTEHFLLALKNLCAFKTGLPYMPYDTLRLYVSFECCSARNAFPQVKGREQ